MDYLEQQLERLHCIVDSCENLRFQIEFEQKVLCAELSDRLAKDLKGVEAIEHFNSYMSVFGLNHLIIDKGLL